ncbi:MAG: transposase [Acidimicrobiia bacterium]|nr:transposase [Acidimicrobiia bacterium]
MLRRPWSSREGVLMPRPHPPEFRQRAVELARLREKPIAELARDLGISDSCLRNWMHQADLDEGRRSDGMSSAEREELARLRRELRVMGVSTSGFYQRRNQPVTDAELADAYLANTIHDIWTSSRRTYGAPRARAELRLGLRLPCSTGRTERLMRACGAVGLHYRRRGRGCTRRGDGDPAED